MRPLSSSPERASALVPAVLRPPHATRTLLALQAPTLMGAFRRAGSSRHATSGNGAHPAGPAAGGGAAAHAKGVDGSGKGDGRPMGGKGPKVDPSQRHLLSQVRRSSCLAAAPQLPPFRPPARCSAAGTLAGPELTRQACQAPRGTEACEPIITARAGTARGFKPRRPQAQATNGAARARACRTWRARRRRRCTRRTPTGPRSRRVGTGARRAACAPRTW